MCNLHYLQHFLKMFSAEFLLHLIVICPFRYNLNTVDCLHFNVYRFGVEKKHLIPPIEEQERIIKQLSSLLSSLYEIEESITM